MNREELIKLAKSQAPALEWCNDDFWKQYGYFYFGIGDGYKFDESKLNQASDEELWKIIALCSDYWGSRYREWHYRDNENLQKVYEFANEIRKIFDVHDFSYESNFKMLNVALKYIKNSTL